MLSVRTRDRPALTIVANWRLKTTSSLSGTPRQRAKMSSMLADWARCRRRLVTKKPMSQSFWATIASLSPSSEPARAFPAESRAVYSNTAMATCLPVPPHHPAPAHGTGRGSMVPVPARVPLAPRRAGADQPPHLVRVNRPVDRGLGADEPAPVKVGERRVHGLHPVLAPRLDRGLDLVALGLADEVADGGGRDHDLHRREPADLLDRHAGPLHRGDGTAAVRLRGRLLRRPLRSHEPLVRHQLLRDHGFHDGRELGADLRLLVRREDVDDAVDALRRRGRVQ